MEGSKKVWIWVVIALGAVAAAVLVWQVVGGGPGTPANPSSVEYEKPPPPDAGRYRGDGKGLGDAERL